MTEILTLTLILWVQWMMKMPLRKRDFKVKQVKQKEPMERLFQNALRTRMDRPLILQRNSVLSRMSTFYMTTLQLLTPSIYREITTNSLLKMQCLKKMTATVNGSSDPIILKL
jgi:hypothetical protein